MAKTPTHNNRTSLKFDNIIVWRHAEAEQADFELGEQDNARQLTVKGQTQANRMAKWLKQHLPKDTVLICSPAARALQTAEALNYKIQLHDGLKPSASLVDVLNVLTEFTQQKNIIIVGHQPWLGQLVAYLFEQLSCDVADMKSLSIKKGAVWWLRRRLSETTLNQTLAFNQTLTLNQALVLNQKPAYKLLSIQTPSLL